MKKIFPTKLILSLFVILIIQVSSAQTNPTPHDLSTGSWTLTGWNSGVAAGSFPSNGSTGLNATTGVVAGASNANMVFQYYGNSNDQTSATLSTDGDWQCGYNVSARSRFLGNGANGIGFINTGDGNNVTCTGNGGLNQRPYAAVLALDATGRENIQINWTARLIAQGGGSPTPRDFFLLLQYRIGNSGSFITLNNTTFTSIGKVANDFEDFSTTLPSNCNNEALVQIRWVYFQNAQNNGGTRPHISLDDITVSSSAIALPLISTSISSLSGFNYAVTSGPSTSQSYTVSGSNLVGTGNITVSAPVNFEVSLDNLNFSNTLNLPYSGGAITGQPVTVYTRLKENLQPFYFSGNITHSGGSASQTDVSLIGNVTGDGIASWDFESTSLSNPNNPGTASGIGSASFVGATYSAAGGVDPNSNSCVWTNSGSAWAFGSVPPASSEFSFFTSTANYNNIVLTYDMRFSNAATRSVQVQYTTNGGTNWVNFPLSNTTLHRFCDTRGGIDGSKIDVSNPVGSNASDARVRVALDFSGITNTSDNPNFGVRFLPATYSNTGDFRQSNNVTNNATAGTWRFDNVVFEGELIPGTPIINITETVFNQRFCGLTNATSPSQTFSVTATDLTPLSGNLSVSSNTSDYEFSLNNTTFTNTVNISYTGGSLGSTIVYARLKTGLSVGVKNSTFEVNGGGASAATINAEGGVNSPSVFSVGDISLIGQRTSNPDQISFATWIDIPANTLVTFTDNAWNEFVEPNRLNTNEQTLVWNSGASVISSGTVIRGSFQGASIGWNIGTTESGDLLENLSGSGENIFAYTGISQCPQFIHGLSTGAWINSGTPTTNNSYLPAELNVSGGNIVSGSNGNIEYSGSRDNQLSFAAYKTMVSNSVNWSAIGASDNLSIEPFVLAVPTWVGTVSSDWNNANNWNPQVIPSTNDNVIISAVSAPNFNPVLEVDAEVQNITINNGAIFTILTNQSLTVNGILENNGIFNIESDGYLLQTLGSTVLGSGTFNAKRNITGSSNAGVRFVGSLINNATVGSFGFPAGVINGTGQLISTTDCNPNNSAINSPWSRVLQLNESLISNNNCYIELWQALGNGAPLTPGRGYQMWTNGGQTLTFSGAINNGPIHFNGLTNSQGSLGAVGGPNGVGTVDRGWNLVSNPYPSPIQITNAELDAMGFEGQIQVFSTTGGTQGTWNPHNPTSPYLIAPGQGFQIRVKDGFTGNFQLDNDKRVVNSINFFNNYSGIDHHLDINMYGNNFQDQTSIYFKAEATEGFDTKYDANKWLNHNRNTLYTLSTDNNKLAYNAQPMLNGYREIPLNIDVKTNGNFEFNFESVETMPVSVVVYLKDNKTNTMVNLRDQNNYTFTTEIGDAENRFLIIFYPSLSVFTENSNCDINGSIKIEGNGLPWTYNVEDNNGYFIATGIIGNQGEVEVPVMAGTYKLNIQLNNSLYSDVFENIIVEGSIKPTAEINIPEKEVNLGEVVHFYNTSTHSETLEWNFGDGNFSTETNPSHTYYTSGWYEVILRVYSQDQCEAVTSENVWVKSETLNINETTTNPTQISLYSYNQTLYVNIPSEIDIHASSLRLNVMNLDGRLNKIYPLVGVEGVQEIFTDLACGLYLIQITDNKQLYLQTKVILAN